jgi:hypothetical protein
MCICILLEGLHKHDSPTHESHTKYTYMQLLTQHDWNSDLIIQRILDYTLSCTVNVSETMQLHKLSTGTQAQTQTRTQTQSQTQTRTQTQIESHMVASTSQYICEECACAPIMGTQTEHTQTRNKTEPLHKYITDTSGSIAIMFTKALKPAHDCCNACVKRRNLQSEADKEDGTPVNNKAARSGVVGKDTCEMNTMRDSESESTEADLHTGTECVQNVPHEGKGTAYTCMGICKQSSDSCSTCIDLRVSCVNVTPGNMTQNQNHTKLIPNATNATWILSRYICNLTRGLLPLEMYLREYAALVNNESYPYFPPAHLFSFSHPPHVLPPEEPHSGQTMFGSTGENASQPGSLEKHRARIVIPDSGSGSDWSTSEFSDHGYLAQVGCVLVCMCVCLNIVCVYAYVRIFDTGGRHGCVFIYVYVCIIRMCVHVCVVIIVIWCVQNVCMYK